MSRSINRVELLGHLGKDAEVKFTPNGKQVAQFSIATSRRWKPKDSQEWKEETDWHRCVLWNCENVSKFLLKGKQLYITGRMQTRNWDDHGIKRYITEIVCEELILLGGGEARGSGSNSSAPPPAEYEHGVTEDDVPF